MIKTHSITTNLSFMINYQVYVEFDQHGISGLYSEELKSNNAPKFWSAATIVKLDSESLHFYFTRKSLGSYLIGEFFSEDYFLMKEDFLFSKQLNLSLRLPNDSIIPAGQYNYRDMGSRIAVQFSYAQTGESVSGNSGGLVLDTQSHLKAA